MEEIELLKYKRNLYFIRDGLTPEVLRMDNEIKSLEIPMEELFFPEKVVIKRDIEVDDYDYQRDVDHDLSMGAVTE